MNARTGFTRIEITIEEGKNPLLDVFEQDVALATVKLLEGSREFLLDDIRKAAISGIALGHNEFVKRDNYIPKGAIIGLTKELLMFILQRDDIVDFRIHKNNADVTVECRDMNHHFNIDQLTTMTKLQAKVLGLHIKVDYLDKGVMASAKAHWMGSGINSIITMDNEPSAVFSLLGYLLGELHKR